MKRTVVAVTVQLAEVRLLIIHIVSVELKIQLPFHILRRSLNTSSACRNASGVTTDFLEESLEALQEKAVGPGEIQYMHESMAPYCAGFSLL